jgi:hypothetical protein
MAISWTSQDIGKATLQWQVGSICLALNVFEFAINQQTPHSLSTANVVADVEDWMDAILAPIAHDVVVACEILGVEVHKLVAGDWVYAGTGHPATTFDNGGDILATGVAAVLMAPTDASKVRGRKFLPGLAETNTTLGLWTVTVLGHLANCGLAWITPFTMTSDPTSAVIPGVVMKNGTFIGFNGGCYARSVPGYQRRRKEGVGI